jgi:hypothetical protein
MQSSALFAFQCRVDDELCHHRQIPQFQQWSSNAVIAVVIINFLLQQRNSMLGTLQAFRGADNAHVKRLISSQLCVITTSSSESVTWLSSQTGRLLAKLVCDNLPAISSAAEKANTKHSSKELLAILFAPCKPVNEVSPMAYKLARSVWPFLSTFIPPQL